MPKRPTRPFSISNSKAKKVSNDSLGSFEPTKTPYVNNDTPLSLQANEDMVIIEPFTVTKAQNDELLMLEDMFGYDWVANISISGKILALYDRC
jgi:hypothetical protein